MVKAVPDACVDGVCGALTPTDRYREKNMASEGAKGEQPPPLQTLLTAGHGSVETVR